MIDLGDYIAVQPGITIRIFEKEMSAYVKSFGVHGRGPGEFLTLPRIRVNEDRTMLYIFEFMNGQNNFRSYRVSDNLHMEVPRPVIEGPRFIEGEMIFGISVLSTTDHYIYAKYEGRIYFKEKKRTRLFSTKINRCF